LAVLALPWALLVVLPATMRGGLFLDTTRTGMVLLQPMNMVLDLLVLIPVILAAVGVTYGALFGAAFLNALPALLILAALLMVAGLAGALFLLP
jgi:hypothetical protein